MGGISRAGNERLRVLFVSGATSVINAAMRPGSRQMTDWLRALLLRKPRKAVAVALANKMARTAWAMMKSGEFAKLYTQWFQSPIPPKGINLNAPMSKELIDNMKALSDKPAT